MSAEIAQLFPPDDDARGEQRRFAQSVRIAEALLFASSEPLAPAAIAERLPRGIAVEAVLARLKSDYAGHGVGLVCVGGKWLFRTAEDLGWLLSARGRENRKLSRAAMETLAIVAYHQPTTRAEIEAIRGVAVAKGTIDTLLETGWIKLRGRRRAPGRPITYGTTERFLLQFGLERIADLPGLDELSGTGFFDAPMPAGFSVPLPHDGGLRDDEDALEEVDGAGNDLLDEEPLDPGADDLDA